ncbi:hypothetical protein LOK49_LG10G00423 [Camellia lanceoleosa]|uniref:Uncharacterized protein n=1 Tax=Camellia lanceoleosa TaxID=1840588 RepID=A0ACC0GEN2_9ERIC|nr:hypothetical protein LOK49_LG10G00423 [Camellia lanceoleosa]
MQHRKQTESNLRITGAESETYLDEQRRVVLIRITELFCDSIGVGCGDKGTDKGKAKLACLTPGSWLLHSSSSLFFSSTFKVFSMAGSNIAFEDGYTVSTVIDSHEFHINPRSILPQFGSSDLIILDSANSAFYTVSFSKSQEIAVKRLSGGNLGFLDGDLATAKFNNPRSFAVDLNGNVYVADKGNLADGCAAMATEFNDLRGCIGYE